jgi:thiol-disulfide isomerase/thioredoxin
VVAAAFDRARKSHKRVLLDLGGNWCPDCIVLANVMRLPMMQRFMAAHYEFASVDVGRFRQESADPARFGFTAAADGCADRAGGDAGRQAGQWRACLCAQRRAAA